MIPPQRAGDHSDRNSTQRTEPKLLMTEPGKQQKKASFKRHWTQRASYAALRVIVRMGGTLVFGFRTFGRENVPDEGGVLICANHQSNLDPPMLGAVSVRRMNFLAKKDLFRKQPFKWLIEHLDAIPIDRDGMGIGGIKETIRRLKRGEMVLIFPEGQRTFDGEMSPLMGGFCALAKRTRVPMLPIGFDGAFQAWPRGSLLPRRSHIWVVVGKPITPDDYDDLSNEEMIELLETRIRDCFEDARKRRRYAERIKSDPIRSDSIKSDRIK